MGFLASVAEAFEQVAHAAFGIRDGTLLVDPSAHLLGALETVRVEFVLELGELFCAQKAIGTACFQTTESLNAAAVIEVKPDGDGIWDNQKDLGDFAIGMPSVFKQETLEAFPKTCVFFVFVAAGNFRPLFLGQGQ